MKNFTIVVKGNCVDKAKDINLTAAVANDSDYNVVTCIEVKAENAREAVNIARELGVVLFITD